jgi:hypothetical protein
MLPVNDPRPTQIYRLRTPFPLEIAILLAVVIAACVFVAGRGLTG